MDARACQTQHLVIPHHDRRTAIYDCPDCEFGLPGRSNLSDKNKIQRRVESMCDFCGDLRASTRKRVHMNWSSLILHERSGKRLSGFGAIGKEHLQLPNVCARSLDSDMSRTSVLHAQ